MNFSSESALQLNDGEQWYCHTSGADALDRSYPLLWPCMTFQFDVFLILTSALHDWLILTANLTHLFYTVVREGIDVAIEVPSLSRTTALQLLHWLPGALHHRSAVSTCLESQAGGCGIIAAIRHLLVTSKAKPESDSSKVAFENGEPLRPSRQATPATQENWYLSAWSANVQESSFWERKNLSIFVAVRARTVSGQAICYCNIVRGTPFAVAHARTDLYLPYYYFKIASCIIVSVYAYISRKVTFVVGLHVDESSQSGILG
jgi:hypothetical protein